MMDNDRLAVLWNHVSDNMDISRETEEYKNLDHEHWDVLNKIKEIDWSLANDIDEAANAILAYEMHQAFALGFKEAVGLLMGCVK